MNRFAWIPAFILLVIEAPCWAYQTTHAGPSGATVYSSASEQSSVVEKLGPSAPLTISDAATAGFYRCRTGSGALGWVPQGEVSATKPAAASRPQYQTRAAGENGAEIYTQADSASALSGTVMAGEPLTIALKPVNGFYRCNAGGGISGWVPEGEVTTSLYRPTASRRTGERTKSYKAYVGGLLGLGFYSAGSELTFGLNGGVRIDPKWGLGLHFSYASLGSDGYGSVNFSASFMVIAGEANYFFSPQGPGFHLGGKLGIAIATASVSGLASLGIPNSSASTTSIAVGASGGYDWAVPGAKGLTLGGEGEFFFFTSGSSTLLDLLACVKYWF